MKYFHINVCGKYENYWINRYFKGNNLTVLSFASTIFSGEKDFGHKIVTAGKFFQKNWKKVLTKRWGCGNIIERLTGADSREPRGYGCWKQSKESNGPWKLNNDN